MGRILLVDDHPMAARILSLLVSKIAPQEIEVAYDGPSAIEKAEAFRPDMILLDIGLPVMDGYEVARQLRTRDAFRDTFLVALTGYGDDEDRKKSFDAGFDEHCVKPLDVNKLKALLYHPKPERKPRDAR